MISIKVPDLPRKTEAPSFLIRLVDSDMSWNPDSVDTFSVAVFSDTGVPATERHVTETGNSIGIFERPVCITDTAEPVAESFAGSVAYPEPVPADTMGSGDYDEVQAMTLIRMWSGFKVELITDAQLLTSLGFDYPDADMPDWVMTELEVLVVRGDVAVGEFVLALQYVLENF